METKICTKCKKELPITDFYYRDTKKGLRRSECRYCHCEYVKEKYYNRKKYINNKKATIACSKCGECRPYCLDFHHKDFLLKESTIARMTCNQVSKDKLEKEISKCVILCANCHREYHYLNKINGITLEEYLI